jgi:hypothetical protein
MLQQILALGRPGWSPFLRQIQQDKEARDDLWHSELLDRELSEIAEMAQGDEIPDGSARTW